MKFEEITIDYNKTPANDDNWDIDTWRKEKPIDYFKLMRLIIEQANDDIQQLEIFKMIIKITRYYLPDMLYKYYSITSNEELNIKKINDIRNNRIYAATSKELNDPFDGKAFFYDPNRLKDIGVLNDIKEKLINPLSFRSVSLTANGIQSMPMWAHYATNHKGFAVSYSLKDKYNLDVISDTYPVQYTTERMDITSFIQDYSKSLSDEIEKQASTGNQKFCLKDSSIIYLQRLFSNIKHISWSYENEFRCVIAENAPKSPYITAKPNAIYLGMNCDREYADELKNISRLKGIPIYKMGFKDMEEKYNLVKEMY